MAPAVPLGPVDELLAAVQHAQRLELDVGVRPFLAAIRGSPVVVSASTMSIRLRSRLVRLK